MCLFLRNRADYRLADADKKSPLDVALASTHADIVTLLKVAQMDEEMRTGESSQSDDTYQEVLREISEKANDGKTTPSTTHAEIDIDLNPM